MLVREILMLPNHSLSVSDSEIQMESAEVDMIHYLEKHNGSVGLAAFSNQRNNSSLSGRLSFDGRYLHVLNVMDDTGNLLKKLLNYLYAFIKAPLILRRYQFVYIFAPGYCAIIFAFWAALLKVGFGLYVRGTWKDSEGHTSWAWRRIFRKASFMIVTGEAFKKELTKFNDKVENEVPLTAMRPDDIDLNKDYSAVNHRLVFAGRLSKAKGVIDCIYAVNLLRAEYPDISLVIAGGGTVEEEKFIRSIIRENGLEAHVRLLGHLPVERLTEIYQQSGIFVFPSYFAEGFPRVLYEAMMHGCAIVTCPMPGTDGFLVGGSNCMYAPPNDPIKLSGALRPLLQSSDLNQTIATQARADVERVYRLFKDPSHSAQLRRLISEI